MIDTRIQWLKELERISPLITAYNLSETLKDAVFVGRPAGQKPVFHNSDAFNVANSAPHNGVVADAVKALQGKMPESAIRGLIGELTSRNTYGAFSELIVYKWLGDAGVTFEAQVPMTSAEVINPNGSIIDGQVTLAKGKVACLDVKGFGFVAHKIKLLQERLEERLSGKSVLIEGDWNVSIETMQDLLDHAGYSALLSDLQKLPRVTRGPLEFRVQDQRPVTISVHASDPLALALENRDYPMRFASQYARKRPFLLVFVIHPWFSQGELHQNFLGFVDRFTEELSRLAFHSFYGDKTPVEGILRAEAAKLLSGLVFLNGWPAGTDAHTPQPHPFCRIFLNGGAEQALKVSDFEDFHKAFGDGVTITRVERPRGSSVRKWLIAAFLIIVGVVVGYVAAHH